MGRVDEAMRRAAEAGARRGDDRLADTRLVSLDANGADGSPAEIFISETDRPRPRPVVSTGDFHAAKAPGDVTTEPRPSMLPPLSERLNASLEHKVVIDNDMDPVSREQYRRLASGLHAAQAASGLKVVMLASALASEGKTLTAANLALTFSESYHRNVLLIDCDLRRPSVHTVFGLQGSPGLCEGLLASDDRKLPLHHVTARLTALTAGVPTGDPMAALVSDRMRRLIEDARAAFDWVIIDTPPIGLLSDASLLGDLADGAILVVKAEATACDLVERAVAAIGKDRLLGVVLNRARPANGSAYKYHDYYRSTPRA
jgi:capsular exopolysaccharide synthesis family protein